MRPNTSRVCAARSLPFVSVLPSTPDRNSRSPVRTAVDSGRLGYTVGPSVCFSDNDAISVISTSASLPMSSVTAVARAGGSVVKYCRYWSFISSNNESSVRNTLAATTSAYERPAVLSRMPALSRIVFV